MEWSPCQVLQRCVRLLLFVIRANHVGKHPAEVARTVSRRNVDCKNLPAWLESAAFVLLPLHVRNQKFPV